MTRSGDTAECLRRTAAVIDPSVIHTAASGASPGLTSRYSATSPIIAPEAPASSGGVQPLGGCHFLGAHSPELGSASTRGG